MVKRIRITLLVSVVLLSGVSTLGAATRPKSSGVGIGHYILSGTRSADPQGAKGPIQVTQDIYKSAVRGGVSVQVKYQLRIIYNEVEKLVLHANIQEIK